MNTYNDPIAVRGRFGCPVCPARFHSVSEKKKHVREHGPKPPKAEQ